MMLPPLNLPRRPVRLRVPSGKMINDRPFAVSRAAHPKMRDLSGWLRSTSMWPVRFKCGPSTGKRPSDSFAMMRSWNGIDQNNTGMS